MMYIWDQGLSHHFFYLVSELTPYLLASLIVGALTGWRAHGRKSDSAGRGK